MKHGKKHRELGRKKDERNALIKLLAVSLIRDERIETSEAKAKELRPFIEHLVTKARQDSLASRRNVSSALGSDVGVKKLFSEISPKYKGRAGGYTRIVKMPTRAGDRSRRAIIEFI